MRQLNGSGFAPPEMPGEQTRSAPAFHFDVVRSVRMRPKLALGVAAAVFVLIVAYALTRKPVYEAQSLTYIEPLATKVLNDGSPGYFDPSRYDSYIEQQIQTAQRPDILEAAIASLPPGVWRYPGESMASAAARLAGSLQVKRVDTSYQLSISATGPDPVGTAAVVNAVTDAYLQQGSKDEHAISDGRIQLLNEERQRINNELTQAQQEQTSLSASLGVASPTGTSGNPYDMQLEGIRSELVAAQDAHAVAAAQLESMSAAGGSQSPGMIAAADEAIAGDSGLTSMKATINGRRANLESQMAGLTPSNPLYKQDQAEIASVDRDLDAVTAQLRAKAEQRLQDKLRSQLQQTGNVEARLNAQLEHATEQATGAAPKLERATELVTDVTRLQGSLASVDDALRALELETRGPGMAHLSMAATVPSAPEASRKGKLLLAAFPLGLLAGIAVAVFARKRDPHAYTALDVQHVLGFPPMGVMPADEEVSEAVVEEYLLRLAAGVERAYRSDGARSFVFTPVSASTGMSGFLSALQRKLAELGFRALATDVDGVLRPRKEREVEMGLERAGRDGFAAMQLERLQEDYDLLLIEAHPLLLSAETEYAVCATDATVLVAESGVTTCKQLKDAAGLLQRLNVSGVAVVLQHVHLSFAEPEFRAAVEELEKNSYGLYAKVLPSAASAASTGGSVKTFDEKERGFDGQTAGAHGFEVHRPGEKTVAAVLEPRESVAARQQRRRVADVVHERNAQFSQRLDNRDVAVQPETETEKEAAPAAPQLQASESAMAPKGSAMKRASQDEAPKPSFFGRIFKKYNEPVVSILPDDDDDAAVETASPAMADAAAVATPAIAAARVAVVSSDAAALEDRLKQLTKAPAKEELASQAESAIAVAASLAQTAEAILTEPVEAPRETVLLNEDIPLPDVAHETVAQEAEAVAPPAAAVAPPAEAVAAMAYVEPTAEAPTAAKDEPRPAPAVMVFAEKSTAAAAAAFLAREIILPEMAADASAQRPSMEAEPTAVPAADNPAQPVNEAAVVAWSAPFVSGPVQAVPSAAIAEQPVALPAPRMRQWEFRQARKMRELAAANAAEAAHAAEEATGSRRRPRPGLVSATGRRVLIEDAFEAKPEPVAQPRLVKPWTEDNAGTQSAQPTRRWGMLSRFDRRFDTEEADLLHGREVEDEPAVGTYGRASGRGGRQG